MPRFSLKTLLLTVAVIPAGIYGLVNATPLIASLVATVGILTWLATVLAWLDSDGEFRVKARAFLIVSLAFAILTWFGDPDLLVTNRWLQDGHRLLTYKREPSGGYIIGNFPRAEAFTLVGHVYACLIAGLMSGWFAGWLYRRRQRERQVRPEASSP